MMSYQQVSLSLSICDFDMENINSFEDEEVSCEKLLDSVQQLRPLLSGSSNTDFYHSSPVEIMTDDLELLDNNTILHSLEQDMLLSSMGSSSSSMGISSNGISQHLQRPGEDWNWSNEDGDSFWKLEEETPPQEANHLVGISRINKDIPNGSQLEWCEETMGNQTIAKDILDNDVTFTTNDSISPVSKDITNRSGLDWCEEVLGNRTMEKDISEDILDNDATFSNNSMPPPPPIVIASKSEEESIPTILDWLCRDPPKQAEFSDMSDFMDDDADGSKHETSDKASASKNLISERERRKKLNEKLYSLRAIVPKISKMDKASIVGDAITYVKDLQEQVEEMQVDIQKLEAMKDSLASETIVKNNDEVRPFKDANGFTPLKVPNLRVIEVVVHHMQEQTFHLRIHCKKGPGVLVQVTRALEALDFQIVSANLTSVSEHVLNTIVIKVENGKDLKAEELRKTIVEVIRNFGLHL